MVFALSGFSPWLGVAGFRSGLISVVNRFRQLRYITIPNQIALELPKGAANTIEAHFD